MSVRTKPKSTPMNSRTAFFQFMLSTPPLCSSGFLKTNQNGVPRKRSNPVIVHSENGFDAYVLADFVTFLSPAHLFSIPIISDPFLVLKEHFKSAILCRTALHLVFPSLAITGFLNVHTGTCSSYRFIIAMIFISPCKLLSIPCRRACGIWIEIP